MTPLLFGVGAALGWGVGDYAGALASRRIGVLWTSLGMQLIGTTLYAVALAAAGRFPTVTAAAVPWAVALALVGASALFVFYKALALGPIAVVSPVAASYAAVTVVLVVIFLGERLELPQIAAITVTFVGIVLASSDFRAILRTLGRPLPGIRLAFVATLGFGMYGAALAAAAREHDGLELVLLARIASAVLLAAAVLATRAAIPTDRRPATLVLLVLTGVFDTAANVSFVLGVEAGFASIVATGSGLYPVIPVFLAIFFLGERLVPSQYLGIAITVAGLVALGLFS
ncbi:MAG: DMT family transporter [Candidatus Limnocylindria bacterium]